MRDYLFSYATFSSLLAAGLIVAALQNSALTIERFFSLLPYYFLPAIIWLVVLVLVRKFGWYTPPQPSVSIDQGEEFSVTSVENESSHWCAKVMPVLQSVLLVIWGCSFLVSIPFFIGLFSRTYEHILASDSLATYGLILLFVLSTTVVGLLYTFSVYLGCRLIVWMVAHRCRTLQQGVPALCVTRTSKWGRLIHRIFTWERNTTQPFVWWWKNIRHNKRFRKKHYAFLLFLLILAAAYALWVATRPVVLTPADITDEYTLVRDTVPTDGPLIVRLPEGESKFWSRYNVRFEPEVATWWARTDSPDYIAFKFRSDLAVNDTFRMYYELPDGSEIERTFRAVVRPEISLFQPSINTDNVSADTILSFTFNRPMIPLQSLDREYETDIPITITPATAGSFVWTSQRQLDFVPATRLTRSSEYTVTVDDEFYSNDGLQVPTAEYTFTVEPLQLHSKSFATRSQDPLLLQFNQPIDIEQLDIDVRTVDDEVVPLAVSFASSTSFNPETQQKELLVDRSVVEVRPRTSNNRWDFNSRYAVGIRNIRPQEGTLTIPDQTGSFSTKALVQSMSAQSPRSSFVRNNYFDPDGTVEITFTEPVSAEKTEVNGFGISSVSHKKYCVEDTVCSVNKNVLVIAFNASLYGYESEHVLTVGDVYSADGTFIKAADKQITLTSYPRLTASAEVGSNNSSIRSMFICSTNPLIAYDADTYTTLIRSDTPITQFYRTERSQFVTPREGLIGGVADTRSCVGQYSTRVSYRLEYDTKYTFSITPTDIFGNTTQTAYSFTTEAQPESVVEENEGLRKPWMDNLHPQYSVTQPGRTKYTYVSDNLDAFEVSICKMAPEKMLELGGQLDRGDSAPRLCSERRDVTLPVQERAQGPDYTQLDLGRYFGDTRGQYVVTVTHPELRFGRNQNEAQFYDHMYVSVTNLSLVEKRTEKSDRVTATRSDLMDVYAEDSLYWVINQQTLEPVTDGVVAVYTDERNSDQVRNRLNPIASFVTSAKTDNQGIARTKPVADTLGAFVSKDGDVAMVSSWADTLNRSSSLREIERAYVYTDRPIYRPGDEVSFKGIHRIGFDVEYEIFPVDDLLVSVKGPRGSTVYTETLTTNAFGSFNGIATLPEDTPLGSYRVTVETSNGNRVGTSYFSVEEYTPSPFEVSLTSVQEEYIAGEELVVDVSAQHFFGAPVSNGTVSYTITSQDYFFDRSPDRAFSFGEYWYRCYYCRSNDGLVTRGEVSLENGSAAITQALSFEELFDEEDQDSSKIFVVTATVQDGNGRSVSNQESFIVHRADRYVAVQPTSRFTAATESSDIAVLTVDTEGVRSSETVSLLISRYDLKESKRREVDGTFNTKTEEVLVPVYEEVVRTNARGEALVNYTYPQAGRYEVVAVGTDAENNKFRDSFMQYVYGSTTAPVSYGNDRSLEIAVENTDLQVGETSKLIIQSPYQTAKALVTIERDGVLEYEVLDVNQNFFDYDVVVTKAHVPNMVASVLLVSSDPDIKYGQVRYTVDKEIYELDIAVSSNKDTYLPGEEVTLEVVTRNHDGVPVAAEVSIAAVDLSVLALKGNPERDPLTYFYNVKPHTVRTSSNLKHVHEEIEIPTGTKGGGGGEDLSKRERGIFKDTAFWAAEVVTNQAGRATVRFTLPDNLTRWRVETIGVTKDTLVGVNYTEFEERKDIITSPLVPRFVIPGDSLALGAEVLNLTGRTQTVTFTIESESLVVPDNTQTVTIPAEDSVRVFVPVDVPREITQGVHSVRLKAGNTLIEDAIVKEIPIKENTLYETVFLSDFTDGELTNERFLTPTAIHSEAGEVRIDAYTTAGAYLVDSLEYMAAYPYGCSEQLASKISVLATIKRLQNLENIGSEYDPGTVTFRGTEYTIDDAINQGLSRMYQAQNPDDGFGYYRNLKSDIPLSLHILGVLNDLNDAGVVIEQGVLDRANNFALTIGNERANTTAVIDSTYSLDRLLTRMQVLKDIEPRPRAVDAGVAAIRDAITRKNLKHMSTYALAQTALLSDELWWWDRYNVWREVDRRMRENTEGTYISRAPSKLAKTYYETDIANTALLLRAIIQHEKRVEYAEPLLKWLLSQRSNDGAWATTNATHEVVKTVSQYVEWRDEQNADNLVSLLLDGERVAVHDPTQESRLAGLSYETGYDALGLGKEHELTFSQAEQTDRDDTMYYDVAMRYYLDRDTYPARDEGVKVKRAFYALDDTERQNPLTVAAVGDTVIGSVTFRVSSPMRLVGYEDKIPAGFEIINFDYATENREVIEETIAAAEAANDLQAIAAQEDARTFMKTAAYAAMDAVTVYRDERAQTAPSRRSYARELHHTYQELHDDRVFLFVNALQPGTYTHEYYLRALVPGTYQHLPVWIGELYNPEYFGRAAGGEFTITE